MKIVQVNIWQGKLGLQIMDFLKAVKPDFVCMQEVNDLPGRAGYKFFATLNELKEAGGFDHSFLSATYTSRYMERKLRYGNAIMSHLPLTSTETIFTHGEFVENFDITKDDGNIRNLQHVTVEVNGKTLHILNHHGFRIPETKAGNEDTLRSMRTIADVIARLDGPVILCGDFNLAPDSESINVLNSKLRNLSIENGLKRTYTDLSIVNTVCDYIFVNDRVQVEHFEMSDALISDHKALILDFET